MYCAKDTQGEISSSLRARPSTYRAMCASPSATPAPSLWPLPSSSRSQVLRITCAIHLCRKGNRHRLSLKRNELVFARNTKVITRTSSLDVGIPCNDACRWKALSQHGSNGLASDPAFVAGAPTFGGHHGLARPGNEVKRPHFISSRRYRGQSPFSADRIRQDNDRGDRVWHQMIEPGVDAGQRDAVPPAHRSRSTRARTPSRASPPASRDAFPRALIRG
jgi:hypothetical protein